MAPEDPDHPDDERLVETGAPPAAEPPLEDERAVGLPPASADDLGPADEDEHRDEGSPGETLDDPDEIAEPNEPA